MMHVRIFILIIFHNKQLLMAFSPRVLMDMLDLLFPNIKNVDDHALIPKWSNPEIPWEILNSKSSNSLFSQVNNYGISEDIRDFKKKDFNNKISINDDYGPIYVHDDAIISDFVSIEGPCYIGKKSEIRHSSYIRKGSWICDGAVVGNSTEIKNSLLLPGAKAAHFNYVGDSILGYNVNLGAGTKLSNVRNDEKSIRVNIKNKEYVDTCLFKLGSIIGNDVKLGCNVVANPGTIITPGIHINPNSTISGWH